MLTVSVPGTEECFDLSRRGAAAAWNRALNRRFPMKNLREHGNPLVRAVESRRRRLVARLAAARPFERALDVGAEDGTLAAQWRGAGRTTVLLDLDPALLRRAEGARLTADGAELPFADGSFDLVVLSAVLEHALDARALVAESARVLRPGGRVVAYVPWDGAAIAAKRWARRLGVPLGPLHDGQAPGHLRTFSGRSLRALLETVAEAPRVRLDVASFGYYAQADVR